VPDRQPAEVFLGRAAELAQVADVIAQVEAGQSWLVDIEGDPGIGKTALARHCLARTGLRVVAARADQAETDLDFGLVDQLLRAAGRDSELVVPVGGTASAVSSFAVGARLLEMVGD
jgi:predicted ATPase